MTSKKYKRTRCKHCKRLFYPDAKNVGRQKYCNKPECKKASKIESQRKWLEKNPDHFKGEINVKHVQNWREANPGYSKRRKKTKKSDIALQETLLPQSTENTTDNMHFTNRALQDSLRVQSLVITGLIAQITGDTLQDSIAFSAQRLRQLGADVINAANPNKGAGYDIFSSTGICGSSPPDTTSV